MFGLKLGALALGVASVNAYAIEKRQNSQEQVIYWGANDSEGSLADYCDGQGNDIIVLAFLSDYGNGAAPNGYVHDCLINTDGTGSDECAAVGNDIKTCRSMGKKIIISLGGGGATGYPRSQDDARGIAYTLWNSYGSPSATSNSPRPFGDAMVDGWDFDIESDTNIVYYNDIVGRLRELSQGDTSNTYYITGAPECYESGGHMHDLIRSSTFDKLFIQFYNNPPCEAANYVRNIDGGDHFNFDDIYNDLQGTASANAGLYIGIPASEDAADNQAYIRSNELPKLLNDYKTHSGFAGVMLYDAGASDTVNIDGCHYDEEVSSVLTTGYGC
ncbi:glycoside hydrolase family 18 protein [Polychaeton citri CBS 116435]|uniref:Glycoside hydrolase family 18 protein n=1 Tax=Polychaeton citri CBS 116435 TaxID=1314669 RepID=A0A9P4UK64_9PEZI|nr:glycoside hydrolase family 18 protein [Polychaeton citri CBS 116435]